MSDQGREWIYRYILKTKYFQIAVIQKKFLHIRKIRRCPWVLIETSKNGYEWRVRKLI